MISAIDEEMVSQLVVEQDLDQKALKVQELFKFKSFYDQMDFSSKQRLATTKAILELTDSTEIVNFFERRIGKNIWFEDNALVFMRITSEMYRRDVPTQLNRPLYITAKVQDVELKGVLLDVSSFLNIISLDVLDDIGVPREKIQKQPF